MNYIQGQSFWGTQRLFDRSFRKIKETHSTHESPCSVNPRSQWNERDPHFLLSNYEFLSRHFFFSSKIVSLAI